MELVRETVCRPGKGKPEEDELRLNIEPMRVKARRDVLEGDGEDGREFGAEAGGVVGGGVPGVPGAAGAAGEAMVGEV